eukprot:11123521-Karenia_brevis.AAC.1
MDRSLLHKAPEPGVPRLPREYYVACCDRCETPLCVACAPPRECGSCGETPLVPIAKMLTLRSRQ